MLQQKEKSAGIDDDPNFDRKLDLVTAGGPKYVKDQSFILLWWQCHLA